MGVSPIRMPQLGESVTEGTVDRWLKKVGDLVARDEPLVEVVTDKVNAEIPSPFAGTLRAILVSEGTTVAVGTEIAQMDVAGSGQEPTAPAANSNEAKARRITVSATPAPDEVRTKFSPAVRRLAEEHGVDLTTLVGSGHGGRITREDILARINDLRPASTGGTTAPRPPDPALTSSGAATPYVSNADFVSAPAAPVGGEELIRIGAVRRSIAEHMVRSIRTSPHVWLLVEVDVTSLVRYRALTKDAFLSQYGISLTYLPFVARILCDALHEFPFLNSTWTDEGIVLKNYVNLGLAVAVPPDGLVVPVVKGADRLGFIEIAKALADLAERARNRQLKPEEVQGGTFTLNNTGATGSIASQPIINQPQAAILTTELIVKRAVVFGEGIAIRDVMNMCLSFDHRILDGRMAGSFMNWIKRRLEDWTPPEVEA